MRRPDAQGSDLISTGPGGEDPAAVCMECKVVSYDKESCILKGEIVNVSVDESALTDGKVDVAKVRPITFDPFNNAYHVLGEKVGDAWGSGKNLL